MPFTVQFTGANAMEMSGQVRHGQVVMRPNKGKCLGQSLDWLKFGGDHGRVPRGQDEYAACTKCSIHRVQFSHLQYSALKNGGMSNDDAIREIVASPNRRSLEWIGAGKKRTSHWYTHRSTKFLNTARDITRGGDGGYLLLSATHAMGVWIQDGNAVFFDPNTGQCNPVPVAQFPECYSQHVTATYTQGSTFFRESRFVMVCT